ECWERNKSPGRSNFMANAFVLQICFVILGYPDQVIAMFNMLKCPDNQKDYDKFVKILCNENDWDWERVQSSVLANAKFGMNGNMNILNVLEFEEDDDDEDF